MKRYKRLFFTALALLYVAIPVYAKDGWICEKNQKYYYKNNEKIQGFITIDETLYFFSRVNGALKSGWQHASEGTWYQKKTGEVVTGKQVISGKTYFFNEKGIMQTGFIEEDGKLYFYSRVNGALKDGWQHASEGTWYQKKTGEVVTGKQVISGKTYLFNEKGIMQTGFIEEDGKLYFYSRVNGALKDGWQHASEGTWYQNKTGEVVTGKQVISGKTYLFNEKGIMQTGFIEEDGKLYFYSRVNGALKDGWQHASEGIWYQNSVGEVIEGNGITEINGKEYFLEGRYAKIGFIEQEGKIYYFDENTYEKKYGVVSKKYYDLILDSSTGEYQRKQYKPVYYMQNDGRWVNTKYGLGSMGRTGCSPTAMAMAYTSILQREVLPTEVAEYLYNKTDQFNKKLKGTSGMGIIYASDHFGVKWKGIGTKEKFIEALKSGKIVYASMQNGKYATPSYNHSILLVNYNESTNQTYAFDPLKKDNNGWNSINQIWNEQCMDPDDRLGGFAFYSLEEK